MQAIAALSHAVFVDSGFVLRKVGGRAVQSAEASTSPSSNALPADWQSLSGSGACQLAYTHPRSSLTYELALTRLGGKVVVAAIAVEVRLACSAPLWLSPPLIAPAWSQDGRSHTIEVTLADLVRTEAFPLQSSSTAPAAAQDIGFTSAAVAQKLIDDLRRQIIERLLPSVSGHEAISDANVPAASRSPQPPPPRGNAPPMPSHPPSSGQNPLSIGRSDLDPLGGRAPVVPPPFGGAVGPTAGIPGGVPSRGDGMYVGPDHPLFDDRRWNPDRGSPRGPFGGDGFLPSGAVPPGARFDPIVPGAGIGGRAGPPRGGSFGGLPMGLPFHGGSGQRPGGGLGGGEPDWDERASRRTSCETRQADQSSDSAAAREQSRLR